MSKLPSSVEESLQSFVELLLPCSLTHQQGFSSKVDLDEHYLNIKLLKWKHKEKQVVVKEELLENLERRSDLTILQKKCKEQVKYGWDLLLDK